jgi:TRAP-type uncharacterized transport system fused permease subunit
MMLTWKYTLPAFLVPFVFTQSAQGMGILLQAPWTDVLAATLTAAVGIGALAMGLGGWLRGAATLPERIGATVAGLLMVYASPGTDLLGIGLFGLVAMMHLLRFRRAAPAQPPPQRR